MIEAPSDREVNRLVDTIMYCLTAPRIGYGNGTVNWPETLDAQKDEITLQRLAHALDIEREEMCTELEAMLYLSTAFLEGPPTREAFRIYMWLFKRWKPLEALYHHLADDVGELYPSERETLNRLQRHIYRSQMDHVKSKLRAERAAAQDNRAERRRRLRELRKRMGKTTPALLRRP